MTGKYPHPEHTPVSVLPCLVIWSQNHARMPHCLRWGGMASWLGGLGDRCPPHNRELPSKSPAASGGALYFDNMDTSRQSGAWLLPPKEAISMAHCRANIQSSNTTPVLTPRPATDGSHPRTRPCTRAHRPRWPVSRGPPTGLLAAVRGSAWFGGPPRRRFPAHPLVTAKHSS